MVLNLVFLGEDPKKGAERAIALLDHNLDESNKIKLANCLLYYKKRYLELGNDSGTPVRTE